MAAAVTGTAAPLRPIAIVGGGLGGLALAHHLARLQPRLKVTVYERDAGLYSRGQGYYIGLNRDGLDSLALIRTKLPALDRMLQEGLGTLSRIAILTGSLRMLLSFRPAANDSSLVSRWALRDCLAEGVDVCWNKKLSRYTEADDHVSLEFTDGSSAIADLVVGADGAHSVVRTSRCPDLRYEPLGFSNCGGSLSLAAVSDCARFSKEVPSTLMRVCGAEGHSLLAFTFRARGAAANDTSVMWSLSWPKSHATESRAMSAAKEPEELRRVLADAAAATCSSPEIACVISRTPCEQLMAVSTLHSVEPRNTDPLQSVTRVTLIGDAAHATTTHRGLGANTAFVDALLLAEALAQPDWHAALEHYQKEAFVRGFRAVKQSLQSTHMIHATGWVGVLRNVVLWCIGCLLSFVALFR